jgi:hypothetical protein
MISKIYIKIRNKFLWYNLELCKLFNEPDIIGFVKVKRIEWAGHLIRASEKRKIKKVFNTKPERSRKLGRQRLRWEECVWQDIRIVVIKTGGLWRRMQKNGEQF